MAVSKTLFIYVVCFILLLCTDGVLNVAVFKTLLYVCSV